MTFKSTRKLGIYTHSSISTKPNSIQTLRHNKVFLSPNGGWQSGIHRWKIKMLNKTDDEAGIGIDFDLQYINHYC